MLCPCWPANAISPYFPDVLIVAVNDDPPIVIWPVLAKSDEETPAGSAKKSALLVAEPPDVVITMGPGLAPEGTVIVTAVADEDVTELARPLIVAWTALAVAGKLLPLTVTLVPGAPIVGLKLLIEGIGELTA